MTGIHNLLARIVFIHLYFFFEIKLVEWGMPIYGHLVFLIVGTGLSWQVWRDGEISWIMQYRLFQAHSYKSMKNGTDQAHLLKVVFCFCCDLFDWSIRLFGWFNCLVSYPFSGGKMGN